MKTLHPQVDEGSRRGRRTGLAVLGALLGVGGLVAVGFGLAGQEPAVPVAHDIPALSATTATPSSSSSTPSARVGAGKASPTRKPTTVTPVTLPESPPTRLTIKSIGVSSSFEDLGLTDDGEVQAPKDPAKVGWFTGAHTPGSPGVGVVAGHVTWNRVPTVFFKLGTLNRGDRITVKREDGSSATFAVARRSTFPKDHFPTAEVYKATDTPELVLITCGGKYSYNSHSYDSNVIVWADLVSIHPA